jgi:hypothetical protein
MGCFKLSGAVGVGPRVDIARLFLSLAEIRSFWTEMIAVCIGIVMGGVLGGLVTSSVFQGHGSGRFPSRGPKRSLRIGSIQRGRFCLFNRMGPV